MNTRPERCAHAWYESPSVEHPRGAVLTCTFAVFSNNPFTVQGEPICAEHFNAAARESEETMRAKQILRSRT